jgi:pilus assembly protein CpaB
MAQYFGRHSASRFPQEALQVVIPVSISFFFFFALALYLLSEPSNSLPQIRLPETHLPVVQLRPVLVPVRDIEPNEALNPALFRLERRPESAVPVVALDDPEQASGQYSKGFLLKGQPVPKRAITANPPASHIRDSIPDGYRAVSIRVNEVSSVSGWVSPGSQVDVLWIRKARNEFSLVPLVENAQVIAVERTTQQEVKPGGPIPATVTLVAVAEDANKIQLASSSGSLRLNLRNRTESKVLKPQQTITTNQIAGTKPVQPPALKSNGKLVLEGQVFNILPGGKVSSKN